MRALARMAVVMAAGAMTVACGMPKVPQGDVLDINATTASLSADLPDTSAEGSDTLAPLDTVHIRLSGVGSYARAFNDSNYVQLAAGRAIGIVPLSDMRSFWNIRRPLVKVSSNANYVIDRLTHSKPYLVPEAADALGEIGKRFNDSLQAHGGGDYRIVVTSLLRTPDDVKRLRRVNRNAVEESVHQMATTFDITYRRFEPSGDGQASVARTSEDLAALLATVLNAMRNEGRLYVKYERKQGCFHVTVRR